MNCADYWRGQGTILLTGGSSLQTRLKVIVPEKETEDLSDKEVVSGHQPFCTERFSDETQP